MSGGRTGEGARGLSSKPGSWIEGRGCWRAGMRPYALAAWVARAGWPGSVTLRPGAKLHLSGWGTILYLQLWL